MKKRLITLLLAVIMVMSLAVPALAYDPDTGHSTTYAITTGTKIVVSDADNVDLHYNTGDDLVYFVEPGTKLNVEAMYLGVSGQTHGSLGVKPVQKYKIGATTWDHTDLLKEKGGAFDHAVEGRDYVIDSVHAGWFQQYTKTIAIPKTATNSCFMITCEFGTSCGVATIVICQSTSAVVEYVRSTRLRDANAAGNTFIGDWFDAGIRDLYPVYFKVLNAYADGTLPSHELPSITEIDSMPYKYYSTQKYNTKNIGTFLKPNNVPDPFHNEHSWDKSEPYARWGADNAVTKDGSPVIKPNMLNSNNFKAAINGDNTRVLFDYTGEAVRNVLNIDVAEYTNDDTRISLTKGALDKMKSVRCVSGETVNSYFKSENATDLRLIPYALELRTNDTRNDELGWHVMTVAIPADYKILQYDINLPDGDSIDNISMPRAYTDKVNSTTNVRAFSVGSSNIKKGDEVTISLNKDVQPDGTVPTEMRVFNGWSEDPNAATNGAKIYAPGESITLDRDKTLYAIWNAKYTIVHTSTGKSEELPISDTNIVDNVKGDYLYAGYYTDETCTKLATSPAGDKFEPVAGNTYYVKEISNEYANPSLVATYYKNYKDKPVSGLYLITAMDNNDYKDCGFVISSKDNALAGNAFAKTLNVSASGGNYKNYTANTFFSKLSAEDVIGVTSIDKTTNNVDVSVYYVTMDGIRVNGTQTRTIVNSGFVGGDSPLSFPVATANSAKSNSNALNSDAPKADAPNAAPKMFGMPARATVALAKDTGVDRDTGATNMALLDTIYLKEGAATPGNVVEEAKTEDNVLDNPETPDTPDTPATPENPETPDTPETPDVPEQAGTVVITKVDGNNVSKATGKAGNYVGKVSYAEKSGYVFTGWFTDKACTVPADFSNVQSDMTVYAKYVAASDVKISTAKVGLFKNSFKTTISANDNFASASFACSVNGKVVNVDTVKKSGNFVGEWSTSLKLGSKVVVTPTFVTADGTTVYGEAKTFTYFLGLFI